MTNKLEVGKEYANHYGAVFKIVAAPSACNPYFISSIGFNFHADGALVQVDGDPNYNLIIPSDEPGVGETVDGSELIRGGELLDWISGQVKHPLDENKTHNDLLVTFRGKVFDMMSKVKRLKLRMGL